MVQIRAIQWNSNDKLEPAVRENKATNMNSIFRTVVQKKPRFQDWRGIYETLNVEMTMTVQ